MLSDESSSDSETGRFKCQSKPKEEQSSSHKDDFRGRGRPSENDRFRRDFGRQRNERVDFNKHSRDRPRYSRQSPTSRRRNSRERTPRRRSPERQRERDSNRSRHHRSTSKDKRNSRSRSHKSPEIKSRALKSPEIKVRAQKSPEERARAQKSPEARTPRSPEPKSLSAHKSPEPRGRSHKSPEYNAKSHRSPKPKQDMKDEMRRTLEPSPISFSKSRITKRSEERISLSPEYRGKRSEIYRPPPSSSKRKSDSPILVDDHVESDKSEEVQIGSYYKMIPTVIKEKSDVESSEIDSSDDERLRAKLLNLEKELQKTKKRKHKKKHKRKSVRSNDRDEAATAVEVTSTTDIVLKDSEIAVPEVSSTQRTVSKESSEEGEISSGEDTQDSQEQYDASDLRHKLRRSKPETSANPDVCGPTLPPHLQKKRRSDSPDREGPALPPHLKKSKNLGPTIPDNMRKVLAEKDCEFIDYESSDDGIGPLPVGAEDRWSDAHQRLEERALDIKIRKLDGHSMESRKIKSREEWMLELPEGKTKYVGLEARSFRAKAGPDMSDRSSWTDTPEEKAKKAAGVIREEDTEEAIRREARSRLINNRDDEQETMVKKHKKKHRREESLLELHEKKLKKKKKKEDRDDDGKKERRPFSRDVDLQVNRFDEAQKKSIIKKAQGLNTRFSRGEAKYL